jgi:hypothetical protein
MSGPENKKALQSTDPDELEAQRLEEALVTSKRLIAEMQTLLDASKKTHEAHEELLATLKEGRERRRRKRNK